jgi:mannose-6-phosphate isomerase-like protein (cupin superfamily)
MTRVIEQPMVIEAAGNKPKFIEEFIGQVNSDTKKVSIARMRSPCGWLEPGQTPEFDEYVVVLKGMLQVKTTRQIFQVHADQAIMVSAGKWVQYSTPSDEGAEYFSICVPAFSRDTVHRDV